MRHLWLFIVICLLVSLEKLVFESESQGGKTSFPCMSVQTCVLVETS